MKRVIRGTTLATLATAASAGNLAAHPGHVTHGGFWHTVEHALSSPYHLAVVVAAVVLAAAWFAAIRPARAARRARKEAEETTG